MKKTFYLLLACLLSGPSLLAGNCPGDFNCDGSVTVSDLLILLGEFGSSGTGLLSDMNCDGTIDQADVTLFQAVFGESCPCAGDMNYDGVVDAADLALIAPYASTGNLQIDFTCDGVVDINDKNLFYANLDNCGTPIAPSKGKRLAKDELFSIYPNPTQAKVFVSHALQGVDGIEMIVINHMGQEVVRTSSDASLDLRQHPSGLCFVQLRFQGQLLHTKNLLKL
ncbi:MAG: dockerin type I domain-containing protein [Bacteroidota bacterium]